MKNISANVFFYYLFIKEPPRFGGSGEKCFFFSGSSTGNYFRGSGEQAHSFGDLGSPAQK